MGTITEVTGVVSSLLVSEMWALRRRLLRRQLLKRGRLGVLHLAAVLLPAGEREGWREEQRACLNDLGFWARARWRLSALRGMPKLALAMRAAENEESA